MSKSEPDSQPARRAPAAADPRPDESGFENVIAYRPRRRVANDDSPPSPPPQAA